MPRFKVGDLAITINGTFHRRRDGMLCEIVAPLTYGEGWNAIQGKWEHHWAYQIRTIGVSGCQLSLAKPHQLKPIDNPDQDVETEEAHPMQAAADANEASIPALRREANIPEEEVDWLFGEDE